MTEADRARVREALEALEADARRHHRGDLPVRLYVPLVGAWAVLNRYAQADRRAREARGS